ncbi:hypothetical protein D3C80_1606120 [compost metagenome]
MTETDILQCHIAIEMLEALFEINVVFRSIGYSFIDHVLFDFIIDPADRIYQRNESLEIGVDIILNRNAEQVADSLHRHIGSVSNRCINAFLVVSGNVHIGIAQNGEYEELLLQWIK